MNKPNENQSTAGTAQTVPPNAATFTKIEPMPASPPANPGVLPQAPAVKEPVAQTATVSPLLASKAGQS